jgi:hypothetical protein
MTRCFLSLALLLALGACSIPSEQPVGKKAAEPAFRPADETRRFPMQDRVKVEIVEDHLLGNALLPPGNLAEYVSGGKTYHLFLGEAKSGEAAALVMFDYKKTLADSKLLPHMGGYYGMDGGQPVYIFVKGKWLAGIVGLEEAEADPLAREFAARLD